ncbi:MAG: hypothetical protein WBX27_12290 [Specibacter sp.]
MSGPGEPRLAREVLAALLAFGAVSAFAGAVMAIAFDGAGMPPTYLAGSPFHSFLLPGLILGVVVGGTQAFAAVALLTGNRWDLVAAAVAGFGMVIWIFVELAIIHAYSVLQTLYFGLGLLELVLVLALLGIGSSTRPARQDVL